VFTSESVSEGRPDELADQISDVVVDGMLRDDPESRIAVETMVKTGMAIVAGFGGVMTKLTTTQAGYISVPFDGPFKPES